MFFFSRVIFPHPYLCGWVRVGVSASLSFFFSLSLSLSLSVLSGLFTHFPPLSPSLHVQQESVKEKALVASTSLATLAVTSPAFAYNLFSAENAGAIKVWILGLFVGPLGLITIFLPFVCGTINPIQMAINLGLVEGEVSNLRKFKRNGEPMEHGTKFGHKWYDTSAFKNGKDIDFAFTSKTKEAQEKSA